MEHQLDRPSDSLSRRHFIRLGSGLILAAGRPTGTDPSGAAAASSTSTVDTGVDADVGAGPTSIASMASAAVGDGTASLAVRLIRPDDQLDICLVFHDVALDTASNELVSLGSGQPRMQVIFGSQHTVEDGLVDVDNVPPSTAIVTSRSAGPSRIVIDLPTPIPLTVDALLDVANWELRVPTGESAPALDETSLELPAGLIIAPEGSPRVTTTGLPRTEDGVTELWRLGLHSLTADGGGLAFIATNNVVVTDEVANPVPRASDRDQIVRNTTDHTVSWQSAARAPRLELSSHGAFARLSGDWPGADVEQWRQTIVTGRDLVAEIVREGFLLPFGHRVKILDVNSRRLVLDEQSDVVAVLENTKFLCIDGPVVTFDAADGSADPGMEFRRNDGRGLPFTRIEATPTEWIPIDLVAVEDGGGPIDGVSDLVLAGTLDPIPVMFTATDRAGGSGITFTSDATFVDVDNAFDQSPGGTLERIATLLSDTDQTARRTIHLAGQAVAFADELAAGLGKTTFVTNQIELLFNTAVDAVGDALDDAFRLGVFPEVDVATIVDEAISATVGDDVLELVVELHDRWLDFGLDFDAIAGIGNFDQAFLRLQESTEKALGGAARAVAAIDLVAEVFNQTVGVGQDLIDLTQNWSAEDALGTASKILGLIPLHKVLPDIDLSNAVPGIDIPGLDVSFDEDGFKAVFGFTPKIVSVPELGFFVPDGSKAFIENVTCVPLAGEPENTLTIRIEDVTLQIPPGDNNIVELEFSRIEVIESTIDDLIVDPRLEDWRWGSMMKWLSPVTNLLDKLGGGVLDITPVSLDISTDVPLPSIKLGVVSISNLAIFAGVEFPFVQGRVPELSLGLGSAAAPVEISVLGYGAEFYLEVDISPGDGGLRRLTASLELSAMLYGIDIVVASADITLRISALFEIKSGDITFVGAVAIEGNISVLGLLDISVGLVASVSYKSATEKIKLAGSITYSVDTFLGGASGSIPIGDVTFELGDGNSSAAQLTSEASGERRGFAPAAAAVGATASAGNATGAAAAPPATTTTISPGFGERFTELEWTDDYTPAFA